MTDAMDNVSVYKEPETKVEPLSPEKRAELQAKLLAAKVEQSIIVQVLALVDQIGVPLLSKILGGL